jgi:glycogen debranching enzyme
MNKTALLKQAVEVMHANDRGTYSVPTKGLYPFQWNWDSYFTALGLMQINEARAWTEIETLFEHQWPDGMVPHIVFHVKDDGYFPGPDVWRTGREVPTSGITNPPVAGFTVKRLFDRTKDKEFALKHAKALLPKIDKWHEWFYKARDPAGEGLVAIIHPWESGRDNSIDWIEPFAKVPTDGVEPYVRKDTTHVDAEHRPLKEQYDRYIWLVQHFRSLKWDNTKLHDASPFRVVDPGFNAILIRSCFDLADLADTIGEKKIADASRARAKKGLAALEKLWSDKNGQYVCFDRVTGKLIDSSSCGGLLPVFAGVPKERAQAIAKRIEDIAQQVRFIVPSHDPRDPRFDAKRYWRGPVWLIINYMIADGLKLAGETATADKIVKCSLDLIDYGGFAEYYDPRDGAACGGATFTWTAAMVIELLR